MNISDYLKEISHYPLLSKEEERTYSLKAKEGDSEAKDRIVISNLRLVVSVAKKYSNLGIPLLDLIQEGNIGLIKAVEKFDPYLERKFSTYAMFWIKQSILRYISCNRGLIRFPTYIYDNISKIKKSIQRYRVENTSDPCIEFIALEIGMKKKDVEKYLDILEQSLNSLEETCGENGDYHSIIPGDDYLEENIIEEESKSELIKNLECLTPNEKEVIIHRYGLFDKKILTLEEIGNCLNLTRERIRQIQIRAIDKLKLECGYMYN
ncbi:MAG: RNA polymerase sigma factor RpoD/SigA [Cetobacterium sp.]|uniref:sigma-70 family RNA polymerase sigma factor n=1 Tax=unclassified Cetobacterium TaxID=2630983 RepID=UPI00163CA211|nr:RNA polymerase sigma factor RpoD/SigA [Cetobacterium sp. 2A]MBC2855799.1 RNA polymerase sigma factor RpoD/SigA [Cetobacterium sp. 2A]MBC2857218.1 RNA polymerase sigma factor RpoD/SigA [Cetobacterium sp. 2A]MBC2857222.1 RNA polymerase sigma factor RpoD/SigA [Cetobacterium sp. 2A]MBC2857238.1 RNA polymerase sigma factor RpoD/SigA [Cetobacterium sp. 2A]